MKIDSNTLTSNFEFYVEVNGRPAREYLHENQVYLEGRKGSEYSLVFKNKTPNRVLAVMSVDGLSVLDGKSAGQDSPGYVLGPYETIKVPGWKINENSAARFQFQPQESGGADKTYVESLIADGIDVSAQNQGVIGVMVFRQLPPMRTRTVYHYVAPSPQVWPVNDPIWPTWTSVNSLGMSPTTLSASPSVESNTIRASASSAKSYGASNVGAEALAQNSSMGTGFGEQVNFETTSTVFNRDLSAPLWLGVIIYDTLKGLQKRGVNVSTPPSPIEAAFPGMATGCRVPSTYKG